MAYTAFEFQLIVTGASANNEIWQNTWSFDDNAGVGDIADAVTDLRQFYTDIKGLFTASWGAASCVSKNLGNNVSVPVSWANIAGTASGSHLPNEVACRISLDDLAGHHGGPFLAAFSTSAMSSAGLWTTTAQDTVADAVVALNANTQGHDINLRIDRPSVLTTVQARQVKVGLVPDAIRRRRNAIPESYDVRTL